MTFLLASADSAGSTIKHDTVDSGIPMFFIDDVATNSSCTVLMNTLETAYLKLKMKEEKYLPVNGGFSWPVHGP